METLYYIVGAFGFMLVGFAAGWAARGISLEDLRENRAAARKRAEQAAKLRARGLKPSPIGGGAHRAEDVPPLVINPVHSPITDLGVYRVAVADAMRRRPDLTGTWWHPHLTRRWKEDRSG